MLEFRDIEISDRDWINSLLEQSDFMGCEYSFANNMAWRRLSDSKITRYKDFYIISAKHKDSFSATFPAGSGDYHDVISRLREYAGSIGMPLVITGVTEKTLPVFEREFPGEYTADCDPDNSDYIYLAKDLSELKGRKFHQKRNHLARFQQYNWEYSPLTCKDFDECIAFSAMTYNNKNGYDDHSSIVEQFAIHTFFSYFDELGLMGGVIRIDGKVCAFTIGERLNSNTVCVHIEKGNTDYQGIYAAINNEFVKRSCENVMYVNREEDLVIEGLRKAKRSYNPVFLLEKYNISFK